MSVAFFPEGEIEFEIVLGQVKGEIYKNNNTQRVNTRIEKKTIRACDG